ncbi:hypothetical protein [Montanilutibacter psychrotolerans]|uniref:Uncharacterized protein n=1 Tax=Montanilutibacter psychrotolerans TaxID=1327343 RepID=A0A3M8SUQ9_9GAMM|nr:hypothetical protein [Lysobacter psychrotolerans]RNF85078.1 hypothetical protein EER27_04640 [Lysobacter psychrotolerans]
MALPPPSPQSLKQSRRRLTTRGFTGHEHIDGLGVIHMNGGIYDPDLGRFLQRFRKLRSQTSAGSLVDLKVLEAEIARPLTRIRTNEA